MRKTLISLTAAAALLVQQSGANAATAPQSPAVSTAISTIAVGVDDVKAAGVNDVKAAELIAALSVIENVPDAVLAQGDEATKSYVRQQFNSLAM